MVATINKHYKENDLYLQTNTVTRSLKFVDRYIKDFVLF